MHVNLARSSATTAAVHIHLPTMYHVFASLFVVQCMLGVSAPQTISDEEIRTISSQIWAAAESNRIGGNDLQYDVNGPKLFTYVNESLLSTGTYARLIDLLDNYDAVIGNPETCELSCRDEEDAFLDAILATEPIQLLHSWLVDRDLANESTVLFKSDLRQYWLYWYTRSNGTFDSSGFEHTFIGELRGSVTGSHNWVNFYYEEKKGTFVYGPFLGSCEPEVLELSFTWHGQTKAMSSTFMGTSPEVEVALYTLCLLTKIGGNCPVRLGSVETTLTVWDMTNQPLPKTIGSAWPNCP